MGNACSPNHQVQNDGTMEGPIDPALQYQDTQDEQENRRRLKELISNYDQQIGAFEAELNTYNAQIQQKQTSIAEQVVELEKTSEMLHQEQSRVAVLKLQSELRDKELKIAQQNLEENTTKTKTMIEGKLFKFGRAGKLTPKQKWVWFHVLDNGVPVIDYSDNQHAASVNRLVVSKVFTDETLVGGIYYRERVFAVEAGPNKKVLVFAAADHEECKRWYHVIQRAVTEAPENAGEPEPAVFELTFETRPLGFGVDSDFQNEHLIVTSIQNRNLGLVEGVRVLSCNDVSLEGMAHDDRINCLSNTKEPLTIRFSATQDQQKDLQIDLGPDTEDAKRHARTLSMAELFPAEQAMNISPDQHPIVKSNPEFKKWLENPAFESLMQELIHNPLKLNDFMKRADI